MELNTNHFLFIKYIYFIKKYFLSFQNVSNRKWIRKDVLQTKEFAKGNLSEFLEHSL